MKKKIFVGFLVFLCLIAIAHVALYFLINTKGKDVIALAIKKNFNVDAQIGSVSVVFPFGIDIKNFQCQDLSLQRATVYLGVCNPLKPRLTFRKVYLNGLSATVKRDSEKVALLPFWVQKTGVDATRNFNVEATAAPARREEFSFKIRKLFIRNATIDFIDATKPTPLKVSLKDVNLDLFNVVYPELPKCFLKMSADLEKDEIKIKDFAQASGWVDFRNKNMDLNFFIHNYDYLALGEYYPTFWKPDNLGIDKASLSFNAHFFAHNNNLTIESTLILDDLNFQDGVKDTSKTKFLKSAIAVFGAHSEKPSLPIRLHTTMDKFTLDLSSVYAMIREKIKVGPEVYVGQVVDKTKEAVTQGIKEVKTLTVDNAVDTVVGVAGAIHDIATPSRGEKTEAVPEPSEVAAPAQ